MAAKMACSKRCKFLTERLDYRRWCIGNGGCGLLHCNCETLRKEQRAAHLRCEARFLDRQALSEKKLKAKADRAQAGDFHTKAFQGE